jgi:hypothetical protein
MTATFPRARRLLPAFAAILFPATVLSKKFAVCFKARSELRSSYSLA